MRITIIGVLLVLGACTSASEHDLDYLGRSTAVVETNPRVMEQVALGDKTLCIGVHAGFMQGKDLEARLQVELERLFGGNYKIGHDCPPNIKVDILALAQAPKKEVAAMVVAGYGAPIASPGLFQMDMTQDRNPATLGVFGLLGQALREDAKDSEAGTDTVRFLLVDVKINIGAAARTFRFAAHVPYATAGEDWRNNLFGSLDRRLLDLVTDRQEALPGSGGAA